jgi:hypothetical protein
LREEEENRGADIEALGRFVVAADWGVHENCHYLYSIRCGKSADALFGLHFFLRLGIPWKFH